MSYASTSTARSVQAPPMADQRAQVEQSTQKELERLLPNPSLPSHRSWQLIGEITLLQLSPFKVSTAQTLSLDAFIAEPWPKPGAQVADSLEKHQLELSSRMRSNISYTEAAGLIVVLATFASGIRDKVASLLSDQAVEFKAILVESQWNWSEADRRGLTRDILVEILENKAYAWCSSIIKSLIEGRRQLDGAAYEGDPKGPFSPHPDVIDPADYWEWLGSYFSKAFSRQAPPVSLNTQSISVATNTSESKGSINYSMNSWLKSFINSRKAQSATTMGTSVSGTDGKM